MAILNKFRRSLRLEKNKTADTHLASPEAPICHSCGQRTPQRSTFGSFSSSATTNTTAGASYGLSASSSSSSTNSSFLSTSRSSSWEKRPGQYQRSDSGYSSFTYCTSLGSLSPTATSSDERDSSYSEKRASAASSSASSSSPEQTKVVDAPSVISFIAPPKRQATYSSSVYSRYDDNDDSDDDDDHHTTEAFPPLPVMMEDDYDMFDLPPRTLTNYSGKFQPKSRYARLNDLPAASPRASMFTFAEEEDERAGEDRELPHNNDTLAVTPKGGEKSRRRKFSKSLSVTVLPSQLRRLSLGRKDAVQAQESM